MPTCKDCVHYYICPASICYNCYGLCDECGVCSEYGGRVKYEICEDFKGRSKFIELPCKVGDNGDIFWAIDAYVKSPYEYFISPYQCLGIKYGYDCIEGDNTIMLLAVGGREYIFGKEAFLTAEEAEQALMESEKK